MKIFKPLFFDVIGNIKEDNKKSKEYAEFFGLKHDQFKNILKEEGKINLSTANKIMVGLKKRYKDVKDKEITDLFYTESVMGYRPKRIVEEEFATIGGDTALLEVIDKILNPYKR